MPQVFKIGPYVIYFWSDEGKPLEPLHVHITAGKPTSAATKLWITQSGKVIVASRNAEIPEHTLRKLIRIVEANSAEIINLWMEYFEEIHYFC